MCCNLICKQTIIRKSVSFLYFCCGFSWWVFRFRLCNGKVFVDNTYWFEGTWIINLFKLVRRFDSCGFSVNGHCFLICKQVIIGKFGTFPCFSCLNSCTFFYVFCFGFSFARQWLQKPKRNLRLLQYSQIFPLRTSLHPLISSSNVPSMNMQLRLQNKVSFFSLLVCCSNFLFHFSFVNF